MIPDGYKLVPIEPTEEMKVEGRDYLPATPGGVSPKTAGNVYEAMINAAPQPPNQLNTTPVGEAVYQVLYAHEIGATFEDTDKDTYDKHKGKKRILFTAPIPTITQAHVLGGLWFYSFQTL